MALELINKKHESILTHNKYDLPVYFKIADWRSIYFSAGAVIKFGLYANLFIHFQNDDDEWYFYCNSDKDGFELKSSTSKGRKATYSYSSSLVNIIKKRTLCSFGTRFPIIDLQAKFENNPLYQIDFKKPMG